MYSIVKTVNGNSREVQQGLKKDEAVKKLAYLVDEAAMEINYLTSGDPNEDNGLIIVRENGKVVFYEGDEDATIGDVYFEIVAE